MNRDELAALTKKELVGIARDLDISGRSAMRKAELVEAIAADHGELPPGDEPERSLPIPGIGRDDRITARARRQELDRRLAELVDASRHCRWKSIEGHPCGLPVVVGADRCALHRDGDNYDEAIPALGRLGFDTWPALLRHVALATYDIDPIGLDPVIHEMTWHVLNGLYYDYFRVEVEGIEHVPEDGPAMLVANHGGAALPYDGAMLSLAVLNEMAEPRRLRVTGTEIFNMLPWLSHMYRKVGAAYAARDDATQLLARGALLGVFPEGERGFMKPVWQAYHVQRFGRGGFVELAERTGTPVIPVAIIGAEEVHPALTVSARLAQLVRFVFPQQRVEEIAVFLNPFPLPVRWKIRFLPPVLPEDPGSVPDPLAMLERSEEIRRQVQEALDDLLAKRRTMF
jgi:1-acyl-sn-glycerol-3-phosphate acyltransferase